MSRFHKWQSDNGTEVVDELWSNEVIALYFHPPCECICLTPTDIKRLMACVERWEEHQKAKISVDDTRA